MLFQIPHVYVQLLQMSMYMPIKSRLKLTLKLTKATQRGYLLLNF